MISASWANKVLELKEKHFKTWKIGKFSQEYKLSRIALVPLDISQGETAKMQKNREFIEATPLNVEKVVLG